MIARFGPLVVLIGVALASVWVLRVLDPEAKVVIMTGYLGEDIDGAVAVLQKPVSVAVLHDAVRSALQS